MVPVLILALAALLRLWNLGEPDRMVWDESWYVVDANDYLGGSGFGGLYPHPAEAIEGENTWKHPPLGKLLIALGVGPIPSSPIGWRLPPAIFGILSVGLCYAAGRRLWRSAWWAALAAFLLCIDGLHLVQSRLATLDIFVATFILAAFLALVADRAAAEDDEQPRGRRWERALGGRTRLLAGVAMGAAVATKWSAVPVVVFAVVWAMWWILRATPARERMRVALRSGAALVAVPLLVYLASYGLFFAQRGPDLVGFVRLQTAMLEGHLDTSSNSAGISTPASWPLMTHPMRYDPPPDTPLDAGAARTLALGNPIVWWGALLCLPLLLWRATRRDGWHARLIVGFWLASYLQWFVIGPPGFFSYMLPVVPFMCLGIVEGLHVFPERARRPIGIATAAAAGVVGAAFLPVWLGLDAPWISGLLWLPGWRI